MSEDKRTLSRAVKATLIPQGTEMQLASGENVMITHRLGGNFTVMTDNGMFRIKGKDADALGESVVETEEQSASNHSGPPEMDALWAVLKKYLIQKYPLTLLI